MWLGFKLWWIAEERDSCLMLVVVAVMLPVSFALTGCVRLVKYNEVFGHLPCSTDPRLVSAILLFFIMLNDTMIF